MRVICAWCQQEGKSGLLRVREPLEDQAETHGICERHQQAIFEAFPSASFPTTRWLFIVPARDPARYAHLAQLLHDVAGVTVITDRRKGERRLGGTRPPEERRRLDRRVRRPEVNSLGYALVRFTVRERPAAAPTLTPPSPPLSPPPPPPRRLPPPPAIAKASTLQTRIVAVTTIVITVPRIALSPVLNNVVRRVNLVHFRFQTSSHRIIGGLSRTRVLD